MKKRHKLYMSLISIMLLVITLVSTTFAWFSVSSTVYIEEIEIGVRGAEGIEVSIDGENYTNHLDALTMKKAILLAKGMDIDSNGVSFKYELSNNNLQAVYADYTLQLNDDDINSYFSSFAISPVSSFDGVNFIDSFGDVASLSSGKYLSFKLYFRCLQNIQDLVDYDLFLLPSDYTDPITGELLKGSCIDSKLIDLTLPYATILDDSGNITSLNDSTPFKAKASNAMRFSIKKPDDSVNIYELSDSYNLGSYATNYLGEDLSLNKLYNANYNVMFTYYNFLRPNIPLKPLDYNLIPNTIKSIDNNDPNQLLFSLSNYNDLNRVCSLDFFLWLEGWDADCLDDLDKSLTFNLTFTIDKDK